MSLFDPAIPLHLLKGQEDGLDIHVFITYVESATSRKPRLITPADLRLIPSPYSRTGNALHCVIAKDAAGNEILERIYQVGLELHQAELLSMGPELLREVSLCCFNDLRTIFLVHDKRMLGIVLQELQSLVHKQKILTSAQAETLRRGITLTIIPGSPELSFLTRLSEWNPIIKDNLLLKPIRSGKGAGIVFGSDVTQEEWISQLERLRDPDIGSNGGTCVIQRRIEQPKVDILLYPGEGPQNNYLVGTFMSIHGRYLGLGLWRTSPDRICAISRGGAWICSVSPKDGEKIRCRL
ncbi:hypothetical protein MMC10_010885 [Thelotrema lepadinum]|nr:hypothetical protein [Thelotrema lepadinum]